MLRADTITLIAESGLPRGKFETPSETRNTVYCTIRGVGMNEVYQAMDRGLAPEITFRIANRCDYNEEKRLVWGEKEYKVIRVYYSNDSDYVDLICQRKVG